MTSTDLHISPIVVAFLIGAILSGVAAVTARPIHEDYHRFTKKLKETVTEQSTDVKAEKSRADFLPRFQGGLIWSATPWIKPLPDLLTFLMTNQEKNQITSLKDKRTREVTNQTNTYNSDDPVLGSKMRSKTGFAFKFLRVSRTRDSIKNTNSSDGTDVQETNHSKDQTIGQVANKNHSGDEAKPKKANVAKNVKVSAHKFMASARKRMASVRIGKLPATLFLRQWDARPNQPAEVNAKRKGNMMRRLMSSIRGKSAIMNSLPRYG